MASASLNFFDTRTALIYNFASNVEEYLIKRGRHAAHAAHTAQKDNGLFWPPENP